MSINISARKVQLLVGNKDYSSALLEVSNWHTTALEQSGLIRITATLTLIAVCGLPGSLDDRSNPDWNTGQSISINVTDSRGAFRRHPCGTLRILSAEYNPSDTRLSISAGCLITLLNYRQPTNYASADIVPGTPRSRLSIIYDLMRAAGINNIYCPYILNSPIAYPIRISGSYLQTVGAMLYSIGHVGWIDKQERFCISPVQLLKGNPAMVLQIGGDAGDEQYYRRLSNAEAPREVIRVSGVCPIMQIPEFPKATFSTRYGSAKSVDSNLGNDTIILSYTEEEETWNTDSKIYTRKTNVTTPIGLSLPNNPYGNASQKLGLILSNQATEERTYEMAPDGKLLKKTTEVHKVVGEVMAAYVAATKGDSPGDNYFTGLENTFLAEKTEVYYAYNSKGVPTSITSNKYESIGALLAGTGIDWHMFTSLPAELKLSSTLVESWEEKHKGDWQHTIYAYGTIAKIKPEIANALDSDDISGRLAMTIDSDATVREESNSGQTVPPAPERHTPKATFEDKQIVGEVIITQVGSNAYRERSRTYSIDYLEAAPDETEMNAALAQCRTVAKIEGELLYGRFKGQEIGLDFKDKLFDWEPLMRVDCHEPDGTTRAFCLDDAHWFLGADKALCNFGAIYLGVSASATRSVQVRTTARSPKSATTIQVEKLKDSIPAGVVLNLGGVEVRTAAFTEKGADAIAVAATSTIIEIASKGTYTESILNLPIDVRTTTKGIQMTWDRMMPSAWNGMIEQTWKAV